MTGHTSTDLMCAITLHQPWASLIALGLKTVETRSWPAPARLVAQRIAIHAGKRVVRQPGDAIERELRVRLGEDWRLTMPTGAVLATAVLAGMTQVADMDLRAGYVVHDLSTEVGCAVGTRRTPLYPWGGFSSGRWLWFLTDVDTLPEPAPTVSAANPFGSGAPVIAVGTPIGASILSCTSPLRRRATGRGTSGFGRRRDGGRPRAEQDFTTQPSSSGAMAFTRCSQLRGSHQRWNSLQDGDDLA